MNEETEGSSFLSNLKGAQQQAPAKEQELPGSGFLTNLQKAKELESQKTSTFLPAPGAEPSLVGAPSPTQWAETPEFLQTDREPPQDMPIGEVLSKAVENAPRSAVEFGKSLATPFLEPAQTWEGIKSLGKGVASKAAGWAGIEQNKQEKEAIEAPLDALGQHYANRYGSMEGFKRAFSEDPIGVLADASTALTGGGSLAAKMPGVLGKVGEAAVTAGRATDPINIAMQVPKLTAATVSKPINFGLWLQSGASYNSLDQATKAGLMGNPTFARHMSGAGTIDETVGAVRDAIKNAAEKRGSEYLSGMKEIDNPAALNYGMIDDAMTRAREIAAPKNRVFDPKSDKVQIYQDIQNLVNNWKNNPNVAHDIQSFDQLKREVREYGLKNTNPNTPERKMIDEISGAAKNTIVNADKRYADIMERYAAATDELNEFTRELARGNTTGAKFRKLMANADKPYKKDLIAELSKYNPDIPYMIAGQELRPWMPQGLRGYLGNIITSGGVYGMALHPYAAAGAIMGLPRVSGNIAYRTGQMGSLGERLYKGLPQFAMPLAYQTGVSERLDTGEEEPVQREQRATGGKVVGSIAQRLVANAEKAHKYHQKTTEEILDAPDETVVKALAVAKKHI